MQQSVDAISGSPLFNRKHTMLPMDVAAARDGRLLDTYMFSGVGVSVTHNSDGLVSARVLLVRLLPYQEVIAKLRFGLESLFEHSIYSSG